MQLAWFRSLGFRIVDGHPEVTDHVRGKLRPLARGFLEEHFRHFNAASALDSAKGFEKHLADGGGCCESCSVDRIEAALRRIAERSAAGEQAPARMRIDADGVHFFDSEVRDGG